DQLVRTPAGFAYRVRECPEANPGGVRSMEGAREFQDRILRDTSRRVGWAYAGRVRRSGGNSQVLFDASCVRIRSATRHYGRGGRPRRTRGNCLARWTEARVMVAANNGM